MPAPRNTFENPAIANGISLLDVAETFADVFSSPNAGPSNIHERLLMGDSYPARKLDEDFSLEKLRRALGMWLRKNAPGEDGITYQVLHIS